MSLLKENKRELYKSEFEELLLEKNSSEDVKRIIESLYDEESGLFYSDYVILKRHEKGPSQTFLNRLNLFWFYPIFILTLPFQYLIKGKIGINRESKFGIFMTKIIGEF